MEPVTTELSEISLPKDGDEYQLDWRDRVLALLYQDRQDDAIKLIKEHRYD